jgi:hypothetical protein
LLFASWLEEEFPFWGFARDFKISCASEDAKLKKRNEKKKKKENKTKRKNENKGRKMNQEKEEKMNGKQREVKKGTENDEEGNRRNWSQLQILAAEGHVEDKKSNDNTKILKKKSKKNLLSCECTCSRSPCQLLREPDPQSGIKKQKIE